MAKIRKIYSRVWEKWAEKSIFWPKTAKFWPKTAKFGPKKSNLKKIWAFFKRPKNQFLWQKSEKN